MSAADVHKTVFWAESEFVEDSPIDKLGRCPERTSSRKSMKVPHFFALSLSLFQLIASAAPATRSRNDTSILTVEHTSLRLARQTKKILAEVQIAACDHDFAEITACQFVEKRQKVSVGPDRRDASPAE